ncbi:aminotransferase class I/II-fold pyridoxal phosphate-dependent enzyme [Amycolatopsis sp. NPDC051061]|uniref:aminotransferase class I/II-fold pyridoxal phosphate-dependent enzyme n=1 Tax=Amycolatopsis sp. NPDC051061 TaxID=3155042 RepID=UPI003434A7EC
MLNLTELEQRALDTPINLADGHPRQELTDSQLKVVYRFPELFETAQVESFRELERSAQTEFLHALGQRTAPVADERVFSVYSSSVATMVVGNVLADLGHEVALVHPTFDNLHDILVRKVRVRPLSEADCATADLSGAVAAGATCVFVTTPNNPTGWFLDRDALARLAAACAHHGLLLCLDVSFRGFDTRAQFDNYEVLEAAGVSYVVIEDTGKLWPVSELKLGFLAVSADLRHAVDHVLSEVLLTVSPFVLRLVELLALDAVDGGFERLRGLVAENRRLVTTALHSLDGIDLVDPDARVSVCRIGVGSAAEAERVRAGLVDRAVHVLPCDQFHWARPGEGAGQLRLALARDRDLLADGLRRLAEVWRAVPTGST